MFTKAIALSITSLFCSILFGQTTIGIYLDSVTTNVGKKYTPGVFYAPKTAEAQIDFLGNGIHQNSIRLNIIEGALNNTSNLTDCLAFLDNVSTTLQALSAKTDNLLFIFEKMPAWLSSSSDGSPASTPGWYVLNTKPPANYANWNTAISGIVDRIVNVYGLSNAQFEIWNEPDLGSWTGTKSEYFELFQNTYDAIKSVDVNIPVGGPATNHWGKNINYEPPYGYISNSIGDSSLISELMDSSTVWNRPLDFISWHNFNLVHQTNQNAIEYITQKCTSLGIPIPELMVSEWNTPSVVRDTDLQKAYFIKSQMEMAKTVLNYNMVAAWQDFDQSTSEFHNDYGLLTYGSIHKPAYKSLVLSDKMRGNLIKTSSSASFDIVSSISNDTLNILLVNYAPLPIIEALNHTLFEGGFNASQLDSAGYINLATNDLSVIESIYTGQTTIASSSTLNTAINNSIPIYAHFDSIKVGYRQLELNVMNLTGTHSGIVFNIDSTENNAQFVYDSLIIQGNTQVGAIANITANQNLDQGTATLINGALSISMQANSVRLYQFVVPELLSVQDLTEESLIQVYPNPAKNYVYLKSNQVIGNVQITDISGKVLRLLNVDSFDVSIDLSNYSQGLYFLNFEHLNQSIRLVLSE